MTDERGKSRMTPREPAGIGRPRSHHTRSTDVKAGTTSAGLPQRREVIEQVMRMTDDDLLLLPYLSIEPASGGLLAATGRLLAAVGQPFPLRTPLACWVSNEDRTRVVDHWRELIPTGSITLWSELVFLRQFLGGTSSVDCCPYGELESLRLTALRNT
jgi:hypothetical protein